MFRKLTLLLMVSTVVFAHAEPKPPNVVLFLIDDLNHYGVTAYGANRLHSYGGHFSRQRFSTPNIDAIAQEGIRVNRAFAYPICENSRVALMTGKLNNRNFIQPKALHRSEITFADVFKQHGYVTGLFGKWKQTRGDSEVSAKDYLSELGWDEYTAFDVTLEGQRFINPNLVINGEEHNFNGRTDLDPSTGRRWYGPDIVNRHAREFISKHQQQPFFLYYPLMLVHDDHKPTPATQPPHLFDEFDETAQYNDQGGDDRQYFPDMIEYMDQQIGKVLQTLEDHDLTEDTLVIVMGDNGTKSTFGHVLPNGDIYRGNKGANTHNGIQVPLVLRYPAQLAAGSAEQLNTYDGLVYITDIWPTIADAAGLPLPNAESIDGVSFWPAITTPKPEARASIYSWFIGNNHYSKADQLAIEFAFDKHYKRYAPSQEFPHGRFFDLSQDPYEQTGDKVVHAKWGIKRYSGLPLDTLTQKQRKAYQRLGKVLAAHRFVEAESITIETPQHSLALGQVLPLRASLSPNNTTRSSIIWESSDIRVATVNKFGEVTAHQEGQVTVSAYSWADANPLANGATGDDFLRTGVSDHIRLTITAL